MKLKAAIFSFFVVLLGLTGVAGAKPSCSLHVQSIEADAYVLRYDAADGYARTVRWNGGLVTMASGTTARIPKVDTIFYPTESDEIGVSELIAQCSPPSASTTTSTTGVTTTSSTVAESTTTSSTSPSSTSTSTSTSQASTTTSVPDSILTPASVPSPARELPATGSNVVLYVVVGLALIALGFFVRRIP